jgi:hypothetical protein
MSRVRFETDEVGFGLRLGLTQTAIGLALPSEYLI